MQLNEILIILQNRLASLNEARKSAVAIGDLANVAKIDNDLMTTVTSIEELKKLISLQ